MSEAIHNCTFQFPDYKPMARGEVLNPAAATAFKAQVKAAAEAAGSGKKGGKGGKGKGKGKGKHHHSRNQDDEEDNEEEEGTEGKWVKKLPNDFYFNDVFYFFDGLFLFFL